MIMYIKRKVKRIIYGATVVCQRCGATFDDMAQRSNCPHNPW